MLSNSSKYAVNAVIYLAVHSSENNKVSAKEIAEKLNIPLPFLAKLLQTLARKRAISSVKGPGGGFWLTDKEKQAPLMTIIELVDDTQTFSTCSMSLKGCSETKPCPVHYVVKPFKNELKRQLEENSISFFAEKISSGEAFLFIT
ncbi:Rrf2 family transcriptional regulator [Capnocytophaga sp.]|uniref:RrF2 family transcriptional regulator n=1 Tax=Capnocytophaga sp. TaxID=44737 RepID=UPI0026DD2885|nr:Rrf2 family transcriptional regulator [Capnocytophaga sp.]MDO5106003.1 Rrf2 family transcriptional regulator [Capnocytophaga sp.]